MFPIWALLEFLLFLKLVSIYGFLYVFGMYTLPSFIGFLILAYYPKTLLTTLQTAIQNQEKPNSKMLHSVFIIISGVFFIIPTATSRLIALVLFLPILRHILVFVLMWQWYKFSGRIFKKFKNFNFSSSGFSVYTNFYNSRGFNNREAQSDSPKLKEFEDYDSNDVIDVTPKKIDSSDNNSLP
jgi:UPF0716 family protein affecting phage T7 exclusion